MTEELNLREGKEIVDSIRKKSSDMFPHSLKEVFTKSLKQSLKVSWMLIKIYIPLSLLTILLKQLGVIDYIAPYFAPLMGAMGLPGEAALTLLIGFTVNIYAALATMSAFDLTFRQVTLLAVVVGIAHNLFVETGILTKVRMANIRIAFFRIFVAIPVGIILNLVLPENVAGTVLIRHAGVGEFSWLTTLQGLLMTSVQIMVIIFLITLGYELLIMWRYSSIIKRKVKFIPNAIGLSGKAFGPWIVGFIIGIAYSAGILYQYMQKKELSHKDVCLTTVFIVLAHAIIEDTMLFVVMGGNFWWIILTRIFIASMIVRILSLNNLYKKFLWIGLPKEK
ncbi:MAG: hypothetical protein KKE96_03780 [Candidatus Altiarchaeota archaeon]|nr:hypothetical protein [Candidatus Altiarchaeota archaeon]